MIRVALGRRAQSAAWCCLAWAPLFAAPAQERANLPASVLSLPGNGAVCNGATDDAPAINAALSSLSNGGMVYVAAGSFCLINSTDLSVPANVRIQGVAGPNGANASYSKGSGFILNPRLTIRLGDGSRLESLIVKRAGLISNPTAAQIIGAVAQWGSERSVGISVPANVGGVNIDRVLVIGFNTCMKFSAGAFSVSHAWGDCYNGLEVSSAGDNYYIDDVRFEPLYSLKVDPASGAWARPGIAFDLHDGNTGGVLTRVFSFMYAGGVLMNNVGLTQIVNSGWEWQSPWGSGIAGTVGVRWINHNAQTSVANSYVNGFGTPFSDEGIGEIIVANPSIPSATVTGFNLAGTTATPTSVTIGGAVTAGDSASLTVTSSALRGSRLTLTYTAAAGDTPSTVAAALADLVNHSQGLIAARFFASSTFREVTVSWPYATSAVVSAASSGAMTSTRRSASAQAGSYGAIYGPNIGFTNVAAFTFGKSVNHWVIDAPYLTAYRGWLSAPDASIARQLSLRGISYAHSLTANLTACGAAPRIDEAGTDEAGTITEGALATGCTYTFVVPFFKVPYCTISSPTGTALTSYRATSTALTIVNPKASNAQFTYRCDP